MMNFSQQAQASSLVAVSAAGVENFIRRMSDISRFDSKVLFIIEIIISECENEVLLHRHAVTSTPENRDGHRPTQGLIAGHLEFPYASTTPPSSYGTSR